MKTGFQARVRFAALAGVAAIAFSSTSAFAQGAADIDDADETDADEQVIVVTGTLIRGVEETGSQTIDLGVEEITELGASTTNELLGDIPQVSNLFNERFDADPRAADRLQVGRPNLRNLPGINAATGSTTLILVDGHRMVPLGVDQASFDPDFIAPGSIQRVEVVTDGGSSIYGADAVGGVINFITRTGFDGIQLDAGYEFGDDYDAYNLGVTAGQTFGAASAFFSYSYYDRGILLNGDRDWATLGNWDETGTTLSNSGTQCRVPVGAVTTWFFFGAGWTDNPLAPGAGVTPVGEPCNTHAEGTLVPALERHNALAGFQADLSDGVSLEIKGHFGDSSTRIERYPLGDTVSEPSPNETGQPGSFIGQLTQTAAVGFSYEPNAGYVERDQTFDIRAYGITTELDFDLFSDWQARTTLYWGRSENSRVAPTTDRTRLQAALAAGDIDPTDIAAANPSVVASILNSEVAGEAVQDLFLLRGILDGSLFELGDDAVRLAVGVEYNRDDAKLRAGQFDIGGLASQPFNRSTRDVHSVFGEIFVPLFSIADLSVSGRYDDYSDFGSTFNPNIGLNVTPFDGLRIYGHWGESFNAPTALDGARTAIARFIPGAAAGVPDPNMERTDPDRDDVLLLEGSGGNLLPQEAESWSIGAEFEPVSDLVFNANYYNIDFTNLLGAVNPQLASVVLLNPDQFIFEPTQAEFDQFLGFTDNGVAQFGNIDANDVAVIIDRRVANIGSATLEGLDFSANYRTDIGAAELDLGVAGNYQIDFDVTSNGNTVDQLEYDLTDLTVSTFVGLRTGGFSSRITANHSAGFDTNSAVNQDSVDGFTVVNLFLGYQFPEDSGVFDGLAVRLNVDNVFDQDPPIWRRQQRPNYAFFTLGRVFKLGVTKTF